MSTDPVRNPFRSRFRIALPQRLWWILAAHGLLLLGIWSIQGILTDKEALKYLGCASDVLGGDVTGDLLNRYRMYATYILFLVPFIAIGTPMLAVAVQIGVGIWAACTLRRCVLRLHGTPVQADLVFALFLLAYPIQIWTLALYSESFFVSLSVLFLGEALRIDRPLFRLLILAMLLSFARPVGILFTAPVLVWRVLENSGRTRTNWIWAMGAAVLLAILFLPVHALDQLRVVVEGHAIGGFPKYPNAGSLFHGGTLAAAQAQLIHDNGIGTWAGLVLERIMWLFSLWRPYFSNFHNALTVPFLVLYPLALLTVVRRWKIPFVQVLAVIVLLNGAVVGLTYAEWNGRFLVPLLPVIMLLAVLSFPGRRWL
ncbi:MAG: hypothetical protein IPL81_03370 [Flavobacteriales bacterium]|nr:hypothetical protein [Flavobacteriales bacterium]MBK7248813.1 hypothetical protein [Flavobacteriales bacterium]MBK7288110.1 hypothetical protein [Flavobacteriales bacterium]MBK9058947.1 hypothetical protein [Flavobacteriales bacterium]QQS74058.1 MAG: hypothetical protein IPP95_07595 [Flavobacteriales bacterium]